VLYLTELLVQTLDIADAREAVVQSAVSPTVVGPSLASVLRAWLLDLPSDELAASWRPGSRTPSCPRTARTASSPGWPARASSSSARCRTCCSPATPRSGSTTTSPITSPSMHARQRERALTGAIYRHHPRFAGTPLLYGGDREEAWFEGGDVLVMAPGVLAVGTGQRTTPAGVEAFALRAFAAGIAHTVLAVPDRPGAGDDAPGHHLHDGRPRRRGDVPGGRRHAGRLHRHGARRVRPAGERPEPFLEAAAAAMGIDKLRTIHTGLDPVTAEREQWDDGNNTLAIAPGWSWRTSATPRPTSGSRRPASRWCRSPAASWAAVAAARAA
jgi:arginine deiminase